MKKILFWLAVFAMSLLVMVRPAAAVVEQVPPETAYSATVYRWLSSGQTYSQSFDGHLESCMLWAGVNKPLATYAVLTSGTTASGTCTLYNSGGGWVGSVGFARSSVCPTGYTWNGSQCQNPTSCPVADPPYTYNPATSMCEREAVAPPCPAAGTLHSDGFFNIGTSPYGTLLNSACVSGCTINLISGASPAATQVLDGVKHYFGQAKYEHTGASCSPDTPNFLSDFVGSLPSITCGAGQQMITMSGVTKCFDSQGAEVNVNSASAVAAVVAQGDAAYASMMESVSARALAAGGSASDVVAAQTVAAGVFAAGGSSGSYTGTGFAPDDPMNTFCVQNPQAQICKEQTAGSKTVGTAALSGLYTDGALIGGKTVSSVVDGFKTSVLASGIGSAVGGFFTVNQAAGACPVWSSDVPMFGMMTFDFYCQSTFQNLLPWIRAVLLLIFSVIAFRIAIL